MYGNFPFRETKLVNQKVTNVPSKFDGERTNRNRVRTQSTYLISTPKAVARAREHFNCTLLTGIELEVATIDNK